MSPPPPPHAAPDRFKGCWRWRGQARPGCQFSQFSQFSVLYWQTRARRAGLHSSSRYCQTSLLSSLLSPLLPPPFYPPQHSQLGHLSDQRSEEEPLSSLCFPTRRNIPGLAELSPHTWPELGQVSLSACQSRPGCWPALPLSCLTESH